MIYIIGAVIIIYLIGCFINGVNEARANSYLADKDRKRHKRK